MRRFLPGLVLSASAAFLAPGAQAGQLFVDPVRGSDGNPGTLEEPFKTIGHALAVAPPFSDGIVLAGGVYSAASGEVFPLPLVGTPLFGSSDPFQPSSVISGLGTEILLDAVSTGASGGTVLNLSDLTLTGGRIGLRVSSPANGYVIKLHDVEITGMAERGIECSAVPAGAAPSAVHVQATRLTISGCARGFSFLSESPENTSLLSLVGCDFFFNSVGLEVISRGDVIANVTMSRFHENFVVGVRSFADGGNAQLALEGSLVANNPVGIEAGGQQGDSQLSLQACTIAANGIGVFTDLAVPPLSTHVTSCIVWGNADDLQLAGPVNAQFNDVGDGDFGSINGNLSADPLFLGAAQGDYRLTWGSPAIEAGGPNNSFDLLAHVRPVDGDLDAVSVMDIGCFEFMPLNLVTQHSQWLLPVIPPGGKLTLSAWGAAGASATVLFSLQPIGSPAATGFGFFFLNPSLFFPLATFAAAPIQFGGGLEMLIPNQPALAGLFVSLQALTTSAVAPKGAALTGPVQFLITPVP
jgi:hypothetical protein